MPIAKAKRVKKQLERTIKSVPVADLREIVDEISFEADERIQNESGGERVPGKVVNGQKTIYTENDLIKMFPIVTFTPEETVPLIFNGVRYQAMNGVEMHVPQCIKEIYDRHKRELRKRPELPEEGYVNEVALGVGALEPERTIKA